MISEEIIQRLPDARAINQLVVFLMGCNNNEIEKIIDYLYCYPPEKDKRRFIRGSIFKLIPRVVKDEKTLIKYLSIGFSLKKVTAMYPFLNSIVPKLGYKKFINFLYELAHRYPDQIACVWYYLVPFIHQKAPQYMHHLKNIETIIDNNLDKSLMEYWIRSKQDFTLE